MLNLYKLLDPAFTLPGIAELPGQIFVRQAGDRVRQLRGE